MNLFEDLVEELKDENLLEATVIETIELENLAEIAEINELALKKASPQNANSFPISVVSETTTLSETNTLTTDFHKSEEFDSTILEEVESVVTSTVDATTEKVDKNVKDFIPEINSLFSEHSLNKLDDLESFDPLKQPIQENEFYRRRATEEVSALKIVEHILSGVEREHMKIFPKTYDDVPVSKALHDFLRITQEAQTPEHAQAEFKLMQETESWYSSLSYRDKHISVGDLRRYCETSRPPLSSQALVSLARFYRNSPFSESVRSKFDMVITRLFAKEIENNQRVAVFDKDESIHQLTGLYGDWSSIPLYASDNDPEVLIAALKFSDFVEEVNKVNSFEELIKNDFFNRLRIFKETTGENFFAPLLVTTAIESNIEIGNRYVQLVNLERDKGGVSEIEEKYKYLVDQVVSDTTSKTLQLVELLKKKDEEVQKVSVLNEEKELLELPEISSVEKNEAKSKISSLFRINKWIIIFGVISFIFCLGLFTWVEVLNPQIKQSPNVKTVNLENSLFQEYYKMARINDGTYYAITLPSWDGLSKDTKEDIIKKTLELGKTQGFNKVHLIDREGKTVGFASENGIEQIPHQ